MLFFKSAEWNMLKLRSADARSGCLDVQDDIVRILTILDYILYYIVLGEQSMDVHLVRQAGDSRTVDQQFFDDRCAGTD